MFRVCHGARLRVTGLSGFRASGTKFRVRVLRLWNSRVEGLGCEIPACFGKDLCRSRVLNP